jgi:tRNA(fMet)-specific endonuclease VapC
MYVLDTNIVSTLLDQRRNNLNLSRRILAEVSEHLFISVITVEEIISGGLSSVNRVRQTPAVVSKYQDFVWLFDALHRFQILPYTSTAYQIYRSMTMRQKRVGTQDCRIAATAIALGYTVVTANTSDFYKIGGVAVEDWTIDPGVS